MTLLNDPGRSHLVMDAVDRLPQTGAKGFGLRRRMEDKPIEHKLYIDKHGEDLSEIRGWTRPNPR